MSSVIRGSDNFDSKVIGQEQTWQDMSGSRAVSTDYTNSTSRPSQVSVSVSASVSLVSLIVGGVVAAVAQPAASTVSTVTAIIPDGATYSVTYAGTISNWSELR